MRTSGLRDGSSTIIFSLSSDGRENCSPMEVAVWGSVDDWTM
jgi:hypothetical protein